MKEWIPVDRRAARPRRLRPELWVFAVLAAVALSFSGYHSYLEHSYRYRHLGFSPGPFAWEDRNPDAFFQYRCRMTKYTLPDTFRAAEETRKLFVSLKSGKISQAEFVTESDKLISRLGDLIDEVKGRAAPTVFHKPAVALATSHGNFYTCLSKLQKLPEASTEQERATVFDDAWEDWLRGYKNARIAKAGIRMDIDFTQTR